MLNKTKAELTAAQLDSLLVELGVKDRPYPMRTRSQIVDDKGNRITVRQLGTIEAPEDDSSKSLKIYTERSYAEVFGLAYREMPTPGMLPLFADALNRRQPDSKRRIQYLKGAPGAGKTFMSEWIGRMRSKQGPIIVNCGDKNLSELLYETVLDFNGNRTFYEELEKRLRNNAMNPMSVQIMRESLGVAFVEYGGRINIDWSRVGERREPPAGMTKDEADSFRKHPEYTMSQRERVQVAVNALRQVATLEGLSDMSGNALGMATQEGPLIRAYKEGREIILDEYNKSKEGTDGMLQTVLQFLAGEIDEPPPVENTLKEKGDAVAQTFTFRRQEMKVGFFVTLTGNSEEDGATTRELSQSVHSRVHPQFIPNATEEDWQHRICQMLTGVPISTIYRASEDKWKNDPDGFREFLQQVRVVGLSEDQKRNVPELQKRLLTRWEDVMEASGRLAKFYYGWSQMVNPESDLARAGTLSKIMMELDERYTSEVSIDFRKIIDHIKEAMEIRPDVRAPSESDGFRWKDLSQPPKRSRKSAEEDPVLQFGTRMSSVLLEHISKTTIDIGKTNLYNQLMTHAADCGVTTATLAEGKASKRRTIAQLLDENPFETRNVHMRVEAIRNMICDHIRRKYPGIQAPNEEILTTNMVRRTIEDMAEENRRALDIMTGGDGADVPVEPDQHEEIYDLGEPIQYVAENGAESSDLLVVNDESGPEGVAYSPLRRVSTLDMNRVENIDPETLPTVDDLLSDQDLLMTLALPQVGNYNLESFWNRSLTGSGLVSQGDEAGKPLDKSVAVAEGQSPDGLAMTTIIVRHDGERGARAVPMHVVWNQANDKLLIVGEGLQPGLKTLFNQRGITFVNRNDEYAEKKVNLALKRILEAENASVPMGSLRRAFLMRNMVEDKDEESRASLASLLTRRDVVTYVPNFVLNSSAIPAPRAA